MAQVLVHISKNVIKAATAVTITFVCGSGAVMAKTPRTNYATTPYWDACFVTSGKTYGIHPDLLRNISTVESRGNPRAISPVGAIGLMQIDSSWLKKLSNFGISKSDLFEPCTNINVGAWILAHEFKRHGNNWEAIGAYNASCTKLKGEKCRSQRAWYSWKVFQANRNVKVTQAPLTMPKGNSTPPNPLQAIRIAEATTTPHE